MNNTLSKEVFLSIIIPSYNEATRIPHTLETVTQYVQTAGHPAEIVVSDDGSTDETLSVVQELQKTVPFLRAIAFKENSGKGHAVRKGIMSAQGKYILMTDADLSTPVEEFDCFLPYLEQGVDIVIGTRKHKDATILQHQPIWRESMGKVFTWISNTVLGLDVSDFTCGFKAFEAKAARQIFSQQKVNRWAFDSEVLFLARLYGYQVVEVPVHWKNSPETKVRIIKDTIVSFLSLFAVRVHRILGHYEKL